jgi:glycosyltransferase involved in cell wall biosynthesis
MRIPALIGARQGTKRISGTIRVSPTRAPRISVIIPTYNRKDYIGDAIDSVLQQTCRDVEIIVVDDGSTDGTHERVAEYGEKVRYIFTPNRGIGHARNLGMAHARGEFLAFLDSDDLFYPYMLELESRLLELHPDVGLVYGEMSAFDDDGYFDKYHLKAYHSSAYRDPAITYDRLFERSVALGEFPEMRTVLASEAPDFLERRAYVGHIFDAYLVNIIVFQNNMLMRRNIVQTVGIRNERVKYYEELDYILRITRTHRVCFVDVPTYKLRYHAGQISNTSGKGGRQVWLRKQQELLRVVKRQVFADGLYYEEHRAHLDRCVSRLHRAVAVPLMVADVPSPRGRVYSRRARKHLARCAQLRHSFPTLWCLTFAPAAVRRFGVSLIETARGLSHRWKTGRFFQRA